MTLEETHTIVKGMEAREVLRAIHIDFINDYLTVPVYAEHNGLSEDQAHVLLRLAVMTYNSEHPDA